MAKTATFSASGVSEWVRLFPRQVTETHTSSVTFMKQLTTIAMGTILHAKHLFPEECFVVEKFCGMEVRSLRKTCSDEIAQFLSTALIQAFDAFDKKYLEQLVICFYEGECLAENILEYYVFEYSYNKEVGGGIGLSLRHGLPPAPALKYTFDNVRQKTEKIIQTCLLLVTDFGRKLPRNYDVSLRLYYNEDAPEGYQAPGYENGAEEQDHLASTLDDTVHVGSVATPFHELSTHVYIREDGNYSREAIPTQNPPILSLVEPEGFQGSSRCGIVSAPTELTPPFSTVLETSHTRLQCHCLLVSVDEEAKDALLTCQYCNNQQHALCYGVTRDAASQLSNTHCCLACSDATPERPPTDRRLARLDDEKRTCLCIFRRVLEWCSRVRHISHHQLAEKLRVSPTNAARYIKLLYSYKIIEHGEPADPTALLPIAHDQLEYAIQKFFINNNNNRQLVEQLIAETLSGDSPRLQDPLGAALTPIEMRDIQSDTIIGNVVEPTQTTANVDETLKEYRDAIIMLNKLTKSDLPPPINSDTVSLSSENPEKRTSKRKLSTTRSHGVGTKRRRQSEESTCRKVK